MTTHLVISDCHVTAGQNLERFEWLSRLISDVDPDHFVCVGDFASFDSLSTHHEPGSATDMALPALEAECKAIREAQGSLVFSELNCPSTFIMGNHEERWERFTSRFPKITEGWDNPVLHGICCWEKVVPYKDWVTIDGIQYTHVPHSIMGKPIGGVNACRTVALQSTSNVIFGHTHTMNVANVPFIDGVGSRCALSCPAFMNDGNIEGYARGLPTGWTYGLLLVRPQGPRRPFSYEYISMKDLEDEYSM